MEILVASALLATLLAGLWSAVVVFTSLQQTGEARARHLRVSTSIAAQIVADLQQLAEPLEKVRQPKRSHRSGRNSIASNSARRIRGATPDDSVFGKSSPRLGSTPSSARSSSRERARGAAPRPAAAPKVAVPAADFITGELFGDETSLTIWRLAASTPQPTRADSTHVVVPASADLQLPRTVEGRPTLAAAHGGRGSLDNAGAAHHSTDTQSFASPPPSAWQRLTYRFFPRHVVDTAFDVEPFPGKEQFVPPAGFFREEARQRVAHQYPWGAPNPIERPTHFSMGFDAGRQVHESTSATPLATERATLPAPSTMAEAARMSASPAAPGPHDAHLHQSRDQQHHHHHHHHIDPGTLRSVKVPEIEAARFAYFDGTRWQKRWDSQRESALPVAVKIRLWFCGGSPLAPRQEDGAEQDEEQEFARDEDLAEKSLRETDDAHLDPASGYASHESEWNGQTSERLDLIDLLPDRPADLTRVVCLRVATARGSSTRGGPGRSFDFSNQRWGESRPFSMR